MNTQDPDTVLNEPLLVSQVEVRRLLGFGNTKFHELKKRGVFEIVKVDRRDMVTYRSVKQLAQSKAK